MSKEIIIKGAREHNLKNISLTIPRNKFVVFTGLSGSGKSSLAFDTIYAEGQRRYLESLSAYARQFMEQMKKPDVDSIDGLSPSISIEQKNISRNPRSTVGTVTEVYDYLRLLFARTGVRHCHSCEKPIQSQTLEQIATLVLKDKPDKKFMILSPIARSKKGEYQKELLEIRSKGFTRAFIDGEEVNLSNPIKLSKNIKHDISIVVDRLILKKGIDARLFESLDMALALSEGLAEVWFDGEKKPRLFSTLYACVDCGLSFSALEPRSFSFNSPYGACEACDGLGTKTEFDPYLIVPVPSLSLKEGAILPWETKPKAWKDKIFDALSSHYGFSLTVPFERISEKIKTILFYGSGKEEIEFKVSGKKSFFCPYEGIIASLEKSLEEAESPFETWELEKYLTYPACVVCNGSRLKKESLFTFVGGKNISEFSSLSIEETLNSLKLLTFEKQNNFIAEPILKEIFFRLEFLLNIGLHYLTLSRSACTLSGGEAQRIRLATQIGASLTGVLYVLDEPSIGLHQRDNQKLIQTLKRLRDIGNSVLVVEHDEETILSSDYVVDIGPGAGTHGGEVLFSGKPEDLAKEKRSLTGKYLSGELKITLPTKKRLGYPLVYPQGKISIVGASEHNLKSVSADFPLGCFICVSGVSGSGKSTLIIDMLLKSLESKLNQRPINLLKIKSISGLESIDKVIHVDQAPIGRTPRSNPATYTGLFTEIRTLFAAIPESKVKGYSIGRFSFNVSGGRCETCTGDGTIKLSMNFLPDVFIECEVCLGKRYNKETLEVLYKGKNIADVLDMTVEQAHRFFERIPSIRFKLQTLLDVGLSYVHLGQNAVTLSGGEAQRIKLAKELNRKATGKTVYILDEPTTGLHFDDVNKLLKTIHLLVDLGNTVIVIEHNLDVLKQADYIIDMGPEGGSGGGEVIFSGTPEELIKSPVSYTGKFLKELLNRNHQ